LTEEQRVNNILKRRERRALQKDGIRKDRQRNIGKDEKLHMHERAGVLRFNRSHPAKRSETEIRTAPTEEKPFKRMKAELVKPDEEKKKDNGPVPNVLVVVEPRKLQASTAPERVPIFIWLLGFCPTVPKSEFEP
jgi:hypothetical protein